MKEPALIQHLCASTNPSFDLYSAYADHASKHQSTRDHDLTNFLFFLFTKYRVDELYRIISDPQQFYQTISRYEQELNHEQWQRLTFCLLNCFELDFRHSTVGQQELHPKKLMFNSPGRLEFMLCFCLIFDVFTIEQIVKITRMQILKNKEQQDGSQLIDLLLFARLASAPYNKLFNYAYRQILYTKHPIWPMEHNIIEDHTFKTGLHYFKKDSPTFNQNSGMLLRTKSLPIVPQDTQPVEPAYPELTEHIEQLTSGSTIQQAIGEQNVPILRAYVLDYLMDNSPYGTTLLVNNPILLNNWTVLNTLLLLDDNLYKLLHLGRLPNFLKPDSGNLPKLTSLEDQALKELNIKPEALAKLRLDQPCPELLYAKSLLNVDSDNQDRKLIVKAQRDIFVNPKSTPDLKPVWKMLLEHPHLAQGCIPQHLDKLLRLSKSPDKHWLFKAHTNFNAQIVFSDDYLDIFSDTTRYNLELCNLLSERYPIQRILEIHKKLLPLCHANENDLQSVGTFSFYLTVMELANSQQALSEIDDDILYQKITSIPNDFSFDEPNSSGLYPLSEALMLVGGDKMTVQALSKLNNAIEPVYDASYLNLITRSQHQLSALVRVLTTLSQHPLFGPSAPSLLQYILGLKNHFIHDFLLDYPQQLSRMNPNIALLIMTTVIHEGKMSSASRTLLDAPQAANEQEIIRFVRLLTLLLSIELYAMQNNWWHQGFGEFNLGASIDAFSKLERIIFTNDEDPNRFIKTMPYIFGLRTPDLNTLFGCADNPERILLQMRLVDCIPLLGRSRRQFEGLLNGGLKNLQPYQLNIFNQLLTILMDPEHRDSYKAYFHTFIKLMGNKDLLSLSQSSFELLASKTLDHDKKPFERTLLYFLSDISVFSVRWLLQDSTESSIQKAIECIFLFQSETILRKALWLIGKNAKLNKLLTTEHFATLIKRCPNEHSVLRCLQFLDKLTNKQRPILFANNPIFSEPLDGPDDDFIAFLQRPIPERTKLLSDSAFIDLYNVLRHEDKSISLEDLNPKKPKRTKTLAPQQEHTEQLVQVDQSQISHRMPVRYAWQDQPDSDNEQAPTLKKKSTASTKRARESLELPPEEHLAWPHLFAEANANSDDESVKKKPIPRSDSIDEFWAQGDMEFHEFLQEGDELFHIMDSP